MTKPVQLKTPEKAETLKNALREASTSARKRRSLERVWAALETMRKRGAMDYRIPAVAKELGAEGPKEQSIRNKDGEQYRQLIAAYADEVAPPKRPTLSEDDEDLVLAVSDPALAARLAIVLAQNRALRRRNDILHEQFGKLTEAHGRSTPSPAQTLLPVVGGAVNTGMRRAVGTFLANLPTLGWEVDEDSGAILDRHGGEVAPPYFVDALRLLEAMDEEASAEPRRVSSQSAEA